MTKKRKTHTPELKTKVAITAIKALKTSSELANQKQHQNPAWKPAPDHPWRTYPADNTTAK